MLQFNGIQRGNDNGKSRVIGRRKAADPKRMRKDSRATESLLKRFR